MSDPIKDAWNGVADSFTELGRTMKDRFERDTEDPAETSPKGADPAAALREAFEQLLAAGRGLGDKVTGITRDDALKDNARQVGSSINQALEATIDQITGEMRSFFKGQRPATEPVDTTAASDDAIDDAAGAVEVEVDDVDVLDTEADPASEGGTGTDERPTGS